MMGLRRILSHGSGSAAAEMALLTPIFVVLLLGSLELGRYFYHEHKLVQAVRDSARWAGRQPFADVPACGTTLDSSTSTSPVVTQSKQLARTGQISGGTDRLPKWGDSTTTFTITTSCATSSGSTSYAGIYSGSGVGARKIRIEASLPYDNMFSLPGVGGASLRLNAVQEAAVMGI